jgi:Na+-driven multidrug efflux pump
MLAKQGSLLIFYTMATAMATRMGPMHIATHQIALSLFWLVTMWLDSGSISAQMIMGRNLNNRKNAMSLTKYFVKYSLAQGLAFSVIVGGLGSFVPGVFTQDIGIQTLLLRCLPHLAVQQTVVSLVLILEGLSIGGNEFRFMAAGTAASTIVGVYQLTRATDVVGIWSLAVNTFFGFRLVNAIIGVARVHWSLKKKEQENNWLSADQSSLLPG